MFNHQLANHMTIQPGRSRGEIEYLGSAVMYSVLSSCTYRDSVTAEAPLKLLVLNVCWHELWPV